MISLTKTPTAPIDRAEDGAILRIMGLVREGQISRRTPQGVRIELRAPRLGGLNFLDAPLIALD